MQETMNEQEAMQEQIRLSKIQIRLTCLAVLISLLPYILPQINFFDQLLNKLASQSELPKLTIQLLTSLIPFLILTLIFSFKCIFKKEKVTIIKPDFKNVQNNIPIIEDEKQEVELPNKLITEKLLFLIAVNEAPCFFKDRFAEVMKIDEIKITAYLKTLIAYELITDDGHVDGFINGKKRKKYSITNKGIKYLVKHGIVEW